MAVETALSMKPYTIRILFSGLQKTAELLKRKEFDGVDWEI